MGTFAFISFTTFSEIPELTAFILKSLTHWLKSSFAIELDKIKLQYQVEIEIKDKTLPSNEILQKLTVILIKLLGNINS